MQPHAITSTSPYVRMMPPLRTRFVPATLPAPVVRNVPPVHVTLLVTHDPSANVLMLLHAEATLATTVATVTEAPVATAAVRVAVLHTPAVVGAAVGA